MTGGMFLFLAGAGVAAGLAGSIAGLASLFSYPALLAVGLPPTAANMTNTVALSVTTLGAAVGSRPELTGQARTVGRCAVVVVLGGATGAGLLLVTPPGVFERIVPFLVGGAAAVLLAQPVIRRSVAAVEGPHVLGAGALAGLFAVAAYGGYFGAAAGVLMLALLLVALPVSLLQGNALKNVLLGLANGIAAVGFALLGPVSWGAALPLAAGLLIGSATGPAVARRVPTDVLRIGIGIGGLALAVSLGVDAYG
jgi:uncharacterized membrane protein YfcA